MAKAVANGLLEAHEREKAKLYVCELKGLKDEVINQLLAIGETKENEVSAILEKHVFAQDRDGKRWMRPARDWAHDAKAEMSECLNGNRAMADDIVIATVIEMYAGQMLETLRETQKLSKHNNGTAARVYGPKVEAKQRELKNTAAQLVEDMDEIAGISRITMGSAVDSYLDSMQLALRRARAEEHGAAR